MVLLEAIVFVTMYYYLCMEADIHKARIKEVVQPVNVLAVMLIATGMCFFVNFQLPIVMKVLPENMVKEYTDMIVQAGYGVKWIPTIICLILAPIAEEFLFRGVIFHYLIKLIEIKFTKRKAFWIANIIQALLFGWFHMNLIQGGYAFIIGLVYGFLVSQYRSVVPSIIAHFINNFLSTFIWQLVVQAIPQSNSVYTVGAGFSLCVIVLGFMLCIVNNE